MIKLLSLSLSLLILICNILLISSYNNCNNINNINNNNCIEIKSCDNTIDITTIFINKLSNGQGDSLSSSSIGICYNNNGIIINNIGYNQNYYNGNYSKCNDPIYNLDVNEVFITPYIENDNDNGPYCYNEIDMSPNNIMFEAGIYNPNLNHTGLSSSLRNCDKSGIIHESLLDLSNSIWNSKLQIPWSILYCPLGCPLQSYQDICNNNNNNYGLIGNIFRVNFYRINEIKSTLQCSSGYSSPQTCEYNAWNPTNTYPPSFHEPKYFGYLILV